MCEKHCDGCDGNCDCHEKNFLDDPAFEKEIDKLAEAGWDAAELAVYTEADLLPSNDEKFQEAFMANREIMHGFFRVIGATAKISPPRFMKLLNDVLAKGYSPMLAKSFVAKVIAPETRMMMGKYALVANLKHLACMLFANHDVKIETLSIPEQIKVMVWLPDYFRDLAPDDRLCTLFQCRMFTMLACIHSMTMAREEKNHG